MATNSNRLNWISSRSITILLPFVFTSLSSVCVIAQTPPEPAPVDPAVAGEKKQVKSLEAIPEEVFLQGLMDPFDYEPRGRKDPFAQPVL